MILFATVVGWVHRFLLFQHHLLLKAFRCLRLHQRHCPCSSLLASVWLVVVLAFAILRHLFFSEGSYCMSIIYVFLLFVVGILSFSFLLPSDLLELVLNECLHCRLAREAPVSWLFLLLPRIATRHHSWIVSFLLQVLKFLKIRITQYHSSHCDLNLSSLLDIDVMFLADVLEVWCFMSFHANYFSL